MKLKKIELLICLVLTVLIAGCSTNTQILTSDVKVKDGTVSPLQISEAKNWDLLLGRWYGCQKILDGGIHEWITERHNDGTYEIYFKVTDKNGKISKTTEAGLWGVSGDIYFTIFMGFLKNGVFEPYFRTDYVTREGYYIKVLEETKMVYQEAEGEMNIFTTIKVSDDFDF